VNKLNDWNKLKKVLIAVFLLVIVYFVYIQFQNVAIERNKDYINDFDKLKICMTYEDVKAILGPAYKVESGWIYHFKNKNYEIQYKNIYYKINIIIKV
jgi:regulatory protein YycI of two-component signal transduction system YycFG